MYFLSPLKQKLHAKLSERESYS